MNKKLILMAVSSMFTFLQAPAQRMMEKLDRGLVAVQTTNGVYLSWRVLGEEYYGVTYNVYRDGKKVNDAPLYVSNFTDANGSAQSNYTIKPVVRGIEQATASKVAVPLSKNYKEIKIAKVPSNIDGSDISKYYEPNDAIVADLDGDGEMEILLKLRNTNDAANSYPIDGKDFDIIQVYKLDGTLLWWIDCGPNMVDFQSNEINIAAYDWDQDGKAECVLRGADGMVIHMADGTTKTIGDASVNTRGDLVRSSAMTFTHTGAEYLIYMNGETGNPYYVGEYPLKRLEAGETNLEKAWGDSYGHRSSKNFFGAPYLDGRHPSLFLARGIYTRHKMVAFDVNPKTHQLTERWRWVNNTPGSPWYGQGYHNYTIADVDWDGRDEIVFGSMVIDDNGHGLSTTGLGHGDAHHVGDFNPYVHGQEVAACNEDLPSNNYRDATTSKIYYRLAGGSDDGRSIAGKFTDDLIGSQFFSGHESNLISCVSNKQTNLNTSGISLNFRIFWDGDLLDETFNGSAVRNSNGTIYKYQKGAIETFSGTLTNNDTKSTPCFQGDVFGDWREEVIMRSQDNQSIRIYTTTIPTEHRIPTLLSDPQYRNAMITQMNGYNQPPHVSYFLGEKEGITTPAPAPTMNGKVEVNNGGTISSSTNDKEVILAETNDATVNVADGASPYIFFDNAPTWVQGHDDNDNITTTTYTHTLTGGAFGGEMRLVKLGDGNLILPKVEQKHSGKTEVWAGTLNFDGTMANSKVWLNRFAVLNSDGGKFLKGIEADYGATVRPGGAEKVGTIEADSLTLNFGSIVEFDIDGNGNSDLLKVNTLKVEKKDWENGPEYLVPRFNFVVPEKLKAGTYKIAEIGKVEGDVKNIVLTGLKGHKASLQYENGVLSLNVVDLRSATSVVWTGEEDNQWNLADKSNFKNEAESKADVFVSGDDVTFNDDAKKTNVVLAEDVTPGSVTFDNNALEYTVSGDKAIAGSTSIIKNGEGNVNINNVNTFTGLVNVNAGSLTVDNLGQVDGVNNGALGHYSNVITLNGGTLAVNKSLTASHPIAMGVKGGSVNVGKDATLTLTDKVVGTGNTLTKVGAGTLTLAPVADYAKLIVEEGIVRGQESNSKHGYPKTIELHNATLRDADDMYSYSSNSSNVVVPDGYKASWYLDSRCTYTGTLTGKGTLSLYATNTRNQLNGNWSNFEGNVSIFASKTGQYAPELLLGNSNGMKKASVTVSCPINNKGKNFAFGNLAGSGQLNGIGTWTIGALGKTITYSGTIKGGKIVKTGSGLWTLTKAQSSLGGQTTVNEGVMNLYMPSSTTPCLGKYPIAITGSGILTGIATVYSINVNDGGVLRPGYYSISANYAYGALKATNGIFAYAGSTVKFWLRNAKGTDTSRSFLSTESSLVLEGDVVVEKDHSLNLKAGDSFTLWKAKSFSGTPSSLTLPELPAGLEWDTSKLYQPTGILKVVVSTGISKISANEEFEGTVYTLSGTKVGTLRTTKANMKADLKALGIADGVYIVRVAGESIKVAIQ